MEVGQRAVRPASPASRRRAVCALGATAKLAGTLLHGVLLCAGLVLAVAVVAGLTASALAVHRIFLDRTSLPELGPFIRFEAPAPPTTGHVYDANGAVLIEMATEDRQIVGHDEVPAVLRGALLSAEDVDIPVKIALYRVLQEALSNAYRHGGASGVAVEVREADGRIRLVVRDNGAGFEPHRAPPRGHFGLSGMRDRVEMVGGTFRLESAPGKGTTVTVEVPR